MLSHLFHSKHQLAEKAKFETKQPNGKILILEKGKQKQFKQMSFYSAERHYKIKIFSVLDLSKKLGNKATDINIPTHFPAEWQRYKCTFIVQPTSCAFFSFRRWTMHRSLEHHAVKLEFSCSISMKKRQHEDNLMRTFLVPL